MKRLPIHGFLLGILTPAIIAQEPFLTTPGTASWQTENTAGGFRTVFTINDNTVFDWNTFSLPTGSELVFDFVGGESVLNYLGGSTTNRIDGLVTSNGMVAFFSPQADLVVGGSITAGNVILSTLDADPGEVLGGQGFALASNGSGRDLLVQGTVKATQGSVLIASENLVITGASTVSAVGAVRLAGASNLNVLTSGDAQLTTNSESGFVLHLGRTSAPTIEVAAGGEIQHFGTFDAGDGRIFMEVGSSGRIQQGSEALILGENAFDGMIEVVDFDAELSNWREGDAAPAVSDATLRMPTLRRPDGSQVTSSTMVSYRAPMSASADAGREAKAESSQRRNASTTKPILRRSSFFGMRGGSAKKP